MPFVRVVERNRELPHQIYLSISQNQHDYLISCQCYAGMKEIARLPFKEAKQYDNLSNEILRRWKVAVHNPEVPLIDGDTIAEATATRWVWVDLGPVPDAAGAEQP